jgi:hypothetical protein
MLDTDPVQRGNAGSAREFATFCRRVYARANGFAAVKFDVNLDGTMFFPCPKGT